MEMSSAVRAAAELVKARQRSTYASGHEMSRQAVNHGEGQGRCNGKFWLKLRPSVEIKMMDPCTPFNVAHVLFEFGIVHNYDALQVNSDSYDRNVIAALLAQRCSLMIIIGIRQVDPEVARLC